MIDPLERNTSDDDATIGSGRYRFWIGVNRNFFRSLPGDTTVFRLFRG